MTTPKAKAKPKKKKPVGALERGRPTKLTKEVTTKFTDAVSIGSGYTLAAQYAGVSVEVTAHWMREGRKELARREAGEKADPKNENYLIFLRAVRDAEAEAGIKYQTVLDRAAKTDPQWAYKMQRVRFPLDWIEIPNTMTIPNANIPSGTQEVTWAELMSGVLQKIGTAKESDNTETGDTIPAPKTDGE